MGIEAQNNGVGHGCSLKKCAVNNGVYYNPTRWLKFID
jgi:hypothetical protein